MPPLIRFMIRHFFIGFLMGVALVAALIWFDVFNFGYLVERETNYPMVALFSFLMGMTFGTVQMSVAVMTAEDPGRNLDAVRIPGPEEERRQREIEARKKARDE